MAIGIDETHGKMYFAGGCGSSDFEDVARANLNGSGAEVLFSGGCPAGRTIDVAPQAGFLFWGDRALPPLRGLIRSPLNAPERVLIVPNAGNTFAIDESHEQLYYVDGAFSSILRADFQGSNVTTIVSGIVFLDLAVNPIGPRLADLTVTTANPIAGSPTPEPGRHTFDISQAVQMLANPALGYRFDVWDVMWQIHPLRTRQFTWTEIERFPLAMSRYGNFPWRLIPWMAEPSHRRDCRFGTMEPKLILSLTYMTGFVSSSGLAGRFWIQQAHLARSR